MNPALEGGGGGGGLGVDLLQVCVMAPSLVSLIYPD